MKEEGPISVIWLLDDEDVIDMGVMKYTCGGRNVTKIELMKNHRKRRKEIVYT